MDATHCCATRHSLLSVFRAMPYVNVRIIRGDVTAEQKSQVVAEITQTLQRVLGKQPKHTHVVIDEIAEENWGFAGRLASEWVREQK
jgi:4-oxalocrotonate tautomerase